MISLEKYNNNEKKKKFTGCHGNALKIQVKWKILRARTEFKINTVIMFEYYFLYIYNHYIFYNKIANKESIYFSKLISN